MLRCDREKEEQSHGKSMFFFGGGMLTLARGAASAGMDILWIGEGCQAEVRMLHGHTKAERWRDPAWGSHVYRERLQPPAAPIHSFAAHAPWHCSGCVRWNAAEDASSRGEARPWEARMKRACVWADCPHRVSGKSKRELGETQPPPYSPPLRVPPSVTSDPI